MTDTSLSSLFPAVPVSVGGERLRLRPVVLGELPAAERVVEGWQALVASGGSALDEGALADLQDLCAAAVGRPRAWVDQLPAPDFESLVCLVLSANEEIWRPQRPATGEESFTWTQIIQRLAEHGHSFEAIQGYTLSQARALLGECFRMENEALARDIQAAGFSMASSDSVGKAVKGLLRG